MLKDIGTWALRTPEVRIEFDRRGARIRSGDQVRPLPVTGETYPSYRTILDGLPAARIRVITDRIALGKALTGHPEGASITMRTSEHEVVLECDGPAGTALHAICTGPALRIAFDPDVLLEISSATDSARGHPTPTEQKEPDMDPNNPVVPLCVQDMQAEAEGRNADALLTDLPTRLCARADRKALGLLLPAYLGDLGTDEIVCGSKRPCTCCTRPHGCQKRSKRR